jgi:hypothetical protein
VQSFGSIRAVRADENGRGRVRMNKKERRD